MKGKLPTPNAILAVLRQGFFFFFSSLSLTCKSPGQFPQSLWLCSLCWISRVIWQVTSRGGRASRSSPCSLSQCALPWTLHLFFPNNKVQHCPFSCLLVLYLIPSSWDLISFYICMHGAQRHTRDRLFIWSHYFFIFKQDGKPNSGSIFQVPYPLGPLSFRDLRTPQLYSYFTGSLVSGDFCLFFPFIFDPQGWFRGPFCCVCQDTSALIQGKWSFVSAQRKTLVAG